MKLFSLLTGAALALAAVPAIAEEALPAQPAAITDPVRVTLATQTVDFVFPTGTYARIMDATMDKLMDQIMGSVGAMPVRDLAALGGLDKAQLEELGPGTMQEVMLILDPSFEERMQISTRTMMREMSGLMTQFEPQIREGLAQAYANRFDAKQLGELNAFFATPTGKAYAMESMVIFTDDAVVAKMQAFMPEMMQQMPDIIAKVTEATASLPAPRKPEDLSKAERKKLAALIGVKESELKTPES